MNFLEKILSDQDELVECANVCAKAYANGVGHPEWYKSFDDTDIEKVAQNLAGLQAVNSGISIIASLREVNVEKDFFSILSDIVKGNISEIERGILLRLANCAWGAGQPFRSIEGAMTQMNCLDSLDDNEVAKDWHQIKAVAEWLISKNLEESMHENMHGKKYIVRGHFAKLFCETKAFQMWMDRLNPEIQMDYIELRDSFVVGGKIMLFATVFGVNAVLNDTPINAYAFLRSDAVCIFPVITDENGEKFTVVTEQMRFPFGDVFFESPAGMMDDAKSISGVAVKEMEEELGENITFDKLIFVGTIVMSSGGCSERIHYFVVEMKKQKKEIESMIGRKTGVIEEGENIILHILPCNSKKDLLAAARKLHVNLDAKLLCAESLWSDYSEK